MALSQPLFLGPAQGLRQACFAVLHSPEGSAAPRAALLYLQPPGEELNHARAAAALLARRLAEHGWMVLLLDLAGCGDSEGALQDARWPQWQQDAVAALAWLQAASGCLPWRGGLRASALLAASLPNTRNPLLLWHPPADGASLLRQLQRQARFSSGSNDSPWPEPLLQALGAQALPPQAEPAPVVWLEASADGQPGAQQAARLQAWRSAGWSVHAHTVAQAPFWATPEPVSAQAFVDASVQQLLALQSPPLQAPQALALPTEAQPAPGCREQALLLQAAGVPLLGVLSQPAQGEACAGLVFLVGGPQVRTGAHRLFTRLARQLAAQGVASLRLDLRGMGDSPAHSTRDFQAADAEIEAAAAALRAHAGNAPLALLGLCDGASAALLHLQRGNAAQVAGLVLVNPWVDDAQAAARARVNHHYRERLLSPAFWRRLLQGGVARGALREAWQTWRQARQAASEPQAQTLSAALTQALTQARQPLLLLLSDSDATAQGFAQFLQQLPQPPARLQPQWLQGADHTLSSPAAFQAAAAAVQAWLGDMLASGAPA